MEMGGKPVPLEGTVSIDNGPESSSHFLRWCFNVVEGEFQHDLNDQALSNLRKTNDVVKTLIGHGSPGRFNTGSGQPASQDVALFIGVSNRETWTSIITNLGIKASFETLTICACQAGAGEDGAKLVYHLAKSLGAIVQAPTGMVWEGADGLPPTMEVGADFQMARPSDTQPPVAIDPPTKAKPAVGPAVIRFRRLSPREPVPFTHVQSADFQNPAGGPLFPVAFAPLPPDLAIKSLAFTQLDEPEALRSTPSIVTGWLILTLKDSKEVLTFEIHNDRLLKDTQAENVFYELYYRELRDWFSAPV